MDARASKHTNEALAFMTLFKSMRPEIKEEVKEMIVHELENTDSEIFTSLSFQAWDAEDDAIKESEVWEKYYHERRKI